MDQPFLIDLPPEIIFSILSRLPVKTIVSCKCICKSWLEMFETPEFAKYHLSRSVPGLILSGHNSMSLKIFEFVDELELEHHELHYNPVIEFNGKIFVANMGLESLANGLLFLSGINTQPDILYVCNPITHEYIELPYLDPCHYPSIVTYGFGVSKTSGQYKVVRIYHECVRDPETSLLLSIPKSECQVFTLGTGSWRSIAPRHSYEYNCHSTGAFLNGNLHWLVADLEGSFLISCFDLETELFNTFSPLPRLPGRRRFLGDLLVFEDCLCICDNTSDDEIVIWMMKEYGIEKSWRKEYVISKIPAGQSYECVYPLKVFKDGDILMSWGDLNLIYYSNKTKKTSPTLRCLNSMDIESRLHISSFLSLECFDMETVRKFGFFFGISETSICNELVSCFVTNYESLS